MRSTRACPSIRHDFLDLAARLLNDVKHGIHRKRVHLRKRVHFKIMTYRTGARKIGTCAKRVTRQVRRNLKEESPTSTQFFEDRLKHICNDRGRIMLQD